MTSSTNLIEWTFSGDYDEEKPIIIDAANPTRNLSKRKALELVSKLTGCFIPDSTVCVHAGNEVTYPVIFLAILASGCRWTGSGVAYTSTELRHHLIESGSRYIITDPAYISTVQQAVESMDGEKAQIILLSDLLLDRREPELQNYTTLHDVAKWSPDIPGLWRQTQSIEGDSVAVMMSTSGTTGLPKMTQRTHTALILETQANEDNNWDKPYDKRRLYCTPVYHGFSMPEMLIESLRLGVPSYYAKRFDSTFADHVAEHRITETLAAPPMLLALTELASANADMKQKLQSLCMIVCGGAPLLPDLHERFLRLFSTPPRIVPVWGMTEYGWVASLKYPERDNTGSVGRINTLGAVKMSGEYQVEASKDSPAASELWIQGPQMMTGYRNKGKATADVITQGWLRTGDVGYVSEDGKIYLTGRAKDMIKVDGLAVSPSELESSLLKSEHVIDAAVLGAGHGTDEHPVMFVIPKDEDVTVKMIKKHLFRSVANFKVARSEIRFIAEIPKSPSGKVLRNILRQQV